MYLSLISYNLLVATSPHQSLLSSDPEQSSGGSTLPMNAGVAGGENILSSPLLITEQNTAHQYSPVQPPPPP